MHKQILKKENIKIPTMIYFIFFFIHWIDMRPRPIFQECLQQKPSKVYCRDIVRYNLQLCKNRWHNIVHLIHRLKLSQKSEQLCSQNKLFMNTENLKAIRYNLSEKAGFRITTIGSLACYNILQIRQQFQVEEYHFFCFQKV